MRREGRMDPHSIDWAPIRLADTALRSKNPIRRIVEGLVKPNLPDKPHIPLSLGENEENAAGGTKESPGCWLRPDRDHRHLASLHATRRCPAGDPTVFGNLLAPDVLIDAVAANLK